MSNQFGMICPACSSPDHLDVAATVWVRLTKDGTDPSEAHDGSHEWSESSACCCEHCGWGGKAREAQGAGQ